MSVRAKCRQCSGELHAETIDSMSGEEGTLKVTLSGFPVMVCERGHRHFMVPDFPLKLLKRVTGDDEASLPSGRKKGLIFKEYLCGKCGERLGPEAHTKPFGFDVGVDDFPKFRLQLSVPVYTCPACGHEQLRDREEVRALTPVAMAQGFQAAGLKPEA
ncbi:MAG TPA: hypothetical protein VD839_01010 [Burkholderiales bacterium]|nr:hypothetical protein [Burkholderiales bacterium]